MRRRDGEEGRERGRKGERREGRAMDGRKEGRGVVVSLRDGRRKREGGGLDRRMKEERKRKEGSPVFMDKFSPTSRPCT